MFLDLSLNCLLYSEDVVSQKYNNNGHLKIITSLSLSFLSNIFGSIINFILSKLAEYSEVLEFIIKDSSYKKQYFSNILKFKKYCRLKLIFHYIVEIIFDLFLSYYLIIFCAVYHKTQGSIMINYIIGIAESCAISFGKAILTSFIRYLSLTYRWKNIYNTSKYLFEKF